MKTDRRGHPRAKPDGLTARVVSIDQYHRETAIAADIIDISQSGIRVRIDVSLALNAGEKVKITMSLPNSQQPFSVHGVVIHQDMESECGVAFSRADRLTGCIDDLVFECIDTLDGTLLIKTGDS